MTRAASRAYGRGRRGYTLIELMMGLIPSAMLLGGVSSALYLATRASEPNPTVAHTVQATAILGEITGELRHATAFSQRGATVVEFQVADRNEDGNHETIRYQWSGTPGDPLRRTYNDHAPADVLRNVRSLQFSYDIETVQTPGWTIPEVESAEQLLMERSSGFFLSSCDVKFDRWPGQYFQPVLAPNVFRWSVTRVEVPLRRYTSNQLVHLQLRPTDASGLPTGTIFEQQSINSSLLSTSYTWTGFTFSSVRNLAYDEAVCLVLAADGTTHPALTVYQDGFVWPRMHMIRSFNGGDSWTKYSDRSLLFRVYGTVTTFGDRPVAETRHLKSVSLSLQAGDDAASHVGTRVHVIARPEVSDS